MGEQLPSIPSTIQIRLLFTSPHPPPTTQKKRIVIQRRYNEPHGRTAPLDPLHNPNQTSIYLSTSASYYTEKNKPDVSGELTDTPQTEKY
jgi:hypothetical protein